MRNSWDIAIANLNELVKKSGFSQGKIAKLSDLSQPAVNAYLNKKKQPTLLVLDKFAQAFGVSVAEILTDPTRSQISPRVIEHEPADCARALHQHFSEENAQADEAAVIAEAERTDPQTPDKERA
jgi:transcriptional regulator with XRE-family HTH domain